MTDDTLRAEAEYAVKRSLAGWHPLSAMGWTELVERFIARDKAREAEAKAVANMIEKVVALLLHAEGDDNPATNFSEWSLAFLELRDAKNALDAIRSKSDG